MKKFLSFLMIMVMLFGFTVPSMASEGKEYKVTVSKSSGGYVEGAGSYEEGEKVTITAKAKSGYEFKNWTKVKGIGIEDEEAEILEFEMPANKVSMKANFKKIPT